MDMSGRPALMLHVTTESDARQQVVVAPGVSIGRDPANALVIDSPMVEPIHAVVLQGAEPQPILQCVKDARIRLIDGAEATYIALADGVGFILGPAAVRCVVDEVVAQAAEMVSLLCPRCSFELGSLPSSPKFCPRCGMDLRGEGREEAGRKLDLRRPDWDAECRQLPIRPPQDATAFLHSTILAGYASALHNLGRRYERGQGVWHNQREALRCYLKAAQLGNAQATEKLADMGMLAGNETAIDGPVE